ncbi:MAG TPA: TorF family putative porin [Caulobacteraceae bacterium]
MRLFLTTAAVCLLAGPAAAADDGWSGAATLATQYVSKGAGKSDGDPHASLTLEHGLFAGYAGVWAGNVSTSQGADAEVHLYAGAKRDIAGINLDGRAMHKSLPGTRDGVQDQFWEFRADASRPFGKTKARLRIEYAPDSYAATRQAWWVEGQLSRNISQKWNASAGVGRREQAKGSDYTAWNAGVRYALTKAAGLDVRWYDTDSHELGRNNEGRLVAALSLGF